MIEKIKKLLETTGVKPFICFALIVILVLSTNIFNNSPDSTADEQYTASESESENQSDEEDKPLFDIHIGTGNMIVFFVLIGALLAAQVERSKYDHIDDDK